MGETEIITCAYCGRKRGDHHQPQRVAMNRTLGGCCAGAADFPADKDARRIGGSERKRIIDGRAKHQKPGCLHERTYETMGGAQRCVICNQEILGA